MVLTLLMDPADSEICVNKIIEHQVPLYRPYPIRMYKRTIFPHMKNDRSYHPWRIHHDYFFDYGEGYYQDYDFDTSLARPFRPYHHGGIMHRDKKLIIECGTDQMVTLPLVFPDKRHCYTCEEISLHIKHLNGSFLPDRSFTKFKEITDLHLKNLGIRYISEGAFEELNNCKAIYLTDNRLSSLLPGVFIRLNKLMTLDLSYNAIKNLNYVLLNTSKDMALNLSHNEIDFVDGLITEEKFLRVSSLDLSFNNIFNINFDQVSGSMTNLDLSHNSLSRIIGCIYKISKLVLSHNYIKSLENNCLNQSQEMRYLDMSHNQISSLNFQTFPDNFGINVLLLQYNIINNISSGAFSNLIKLETLNLSNNRIDFLPIGSFENLGNLRTLDLSNNFLKKLNLNIFNSFKSLKEFYINDNAITDFHYRKLLDRFPKLQSISLYNNNLSCDYLIQMLFHLDTNSVNFVHGTTKYSENIHGIPCYSKLTSESHIEPEGKPEKSVQTEVTETTSNLHQQITIFWISMMIMIVLLLTLAFQTYFVHYKCHLKKRDNVEMT